MTKFEFVQSITSAKEFSKLVFELSRKAETSEELEQNLSEEIPKEGLQIIESIARKGDYPLSFDGIQ